MIYTEHTKKAIRLCYAALKNALTTECMPTIVDWCLIAERCPDENTTVAALLHGAVDSGIFDLDFVKKQGFPDDAIYALQILHLHTELRYEEYIKKVQSCPISWVVKHEELKQKGTIGRRERTDLNSKYLDRYWHAKWMLEDIFSTPHCSRPETEEKLLRNRRFQDNIRGCMIGGALGDTVGYCKDGKFSSNTQMCLATANGILHAYTHFVTFGFNMTEMDGVHYAYYDWCDEQNGQEMQRTTTWLTNIPSFGEKRGPDAVCVEMLASRRYSSMKKPIGDNKSWSCLTRVAPFVLYHKNTDSRNDHIKHEMHLAASSAALTHGYPLAWLSSAFLAQILSRMIYGGCTIGDTLNLYLWEGKRLVYELLGNSEHLRALFAIIDKAISLVDNDEDDVENIIKLGSGWDAHECLAIALYCCLRHPMDFRMAVLAASNHPGNTAATACLTGQIMGAKLGYHSIDPSWTNALERQDVILEIADDLTDECQLHRHGEYDDPKWRSKYQNCNFTM